jgi:hypothetical protein
LKRGFPLAVSASLLASCATPRPVPSGADPRLAAAEALIDAFYAFDPVRLRAALADAPKSAPVILYYQGWAEGGSYQVLDRQPCKFVTAAKASCDIKVRDDLVPALKIGFDVTDTFHLTFEDGRIVSVATSSNDPPVFKKALEWIGKERPEVLDGPCKGFFNGGPTPQACVREVIKGFSDFAALKKR